MSLYNELRPTCFDELVGQKQQIAQIKGLLQTELPSSILLIGPRGVGKTTVARIIAKKVNCEKNDIEPCNTCTSCRDIANGSSIDVLELDAASNNKVEDIRRILEGCMYAPLSKKKVYILDEVHMLSKAAFNCLLKTLEEPPANCIFILCTTEEEAVPATILSRCAKFYFSQLDLAEITAYLKKVCDKYHTAYEEGALQMIARSSDGCMRDALSILEIFLKNETLTLQEVSRSLGIETEEVVFQLMEGILSGQLPLALDAFHESVKRGRSIAALLKGIISVCCDIVYAQKGQDILMHTDTYVQNILSLSEKADSDEVMRIAQGFSELLPLVSKTGKGEFAVEAAIIRLMTVSTQEQQLLARVEKLEKEVALLREKTVMSLDNASIERMSTDARIPAESYATISNSDLITADSDSVTAESQPQKDVGIMPVTGIPFEEDLPDVLPKDAFHVSAQDVNDNAADPAESNNVAEPIENSSTTNPVEHNKEENPAETTVEEQKSSTPFVLPDDIVLPGGTVVTGSISLEELATRDSKEAVEQTEEIDDPFQICSFFARR